MYSGNINTVVKQIVSCYEPEKIFLFGSYSMGTQDNDSDIDLFIIKDTDEKPINRIRYLRSIINPYPTALDIFVYTPDEFDAYKNIINSLPFIIKNNGKLIYSKNV